LNKRPNSDKHNTEPT
jgi:hypothetical protein